MTAQLLRKYGCHEKFTTMIESLHTGMIVNVRNGGEVSDTYFAITNGVNQGCVLAPTFFLYFCQKYLEAFRDMGTESTSNHARLFTVAHFRAKTKTQIYL